MKQFRPPPTPVSHGLHPGRSETRDTGRKLFLERLFGDHQVTIDLAGEGHTSRDPEVSRRPCFLQPAACVACGVPKIVRPDRDPHPGYEDDWSISAVDFILRALRVAKAISPESRGSNLGVCVVRRSTNQRCNWDLDDKTDQYLGPHTHISLCTELSAAACLSRALRIHQAEAEQAHGEAVLAACRALDI